MLFKVTRLFILRGLNNMFMGTNKLHKPTFKRTKLIKSGHFLVTKIEENFRIAIINLETYCKSR